MIMTGITTKIMWYQMSPDFQRSRIPQPLVDAMDDVIGITKYRDALAQLDPDERVSVAVDTLGGPQTMTAVTESGLFALMMISRSPDVKPFRRWVTHEVLPQIRRTGSYGKPAEIPTHVEALRGWAAELEARELAEAKVAELEPAAEAWTALSDSAGDFSVRAAAQVLTRDHGIIIGQNQLFRYLRQIWWVDRKNGPYQAQVNNGRLVRRIVDVTNDYGDRIVRVQPRVTVKGLAELRRKLSAAGASEGLFSIDGGNASKLP